MPTFLFCNPNGQSDFQKGWACNSLTSRTNAVLNSHGNQEMLEKLGLSHSLSPTPTCSSHLNALLNLGKS